MNENGLVGTAASPLPHYHYHPTQKLWLFSQALSQPCNTFLSCRNAAAAAATKSPNNLLQLELEIGCGTHQRYIPFSV